MTDQARPLRIAVLIKQVPPYESSPTLDARGRLDRTALPTEMNAWCRRAVTRAVELARATRGHVTAVTMGPPGAVDVLHEAIACGADDAIHVSDPALAGADCLITAQALAAALRTLSSLDVVITGRSSTDGATSALGPMVATLLDLPYAGPVLTLHRTGPHTLHSLLQQDEGESEVEIRLPAVISVAERSCPAAKAAPHIWPLTAPVTTLDLKALPDARRASESPTHVLATRATTTTRHPVLLDGGAEQIDLLLDLITEHLAGPADEAGPPVPNRTRAPAGPAVLAVTADPSSTSARALVGEAARIAAHIGGHTVVAAPSADPVELAAWGADLVLALTGRDPRPLAHALTEWTRHAGPPWAVLGGSTSWDREVLARLGTHLGAGLMSDLTALRIEPAPLQLVGTKPAGSVLADITARGRVRIATLHTGSLPLPTARPSRSLPVRVLDINTDAGVRTTRTHPVDDHDALERAAVVIGVGAGVPADAYRELDDLRRQWGAELAATRKVTDKGALAHGRQLGVTGRSIAPRLYVALGISGSRDHLVGVERARTVVAINHDPDALIFRHCDLGLVADWRDAVRALTARGMSRPPHELFAPR
ncbi:FAD-binding protein [Streptomyces sp. NPDC057636]|uniref:FAD-binding protein n=1 Tax=Streptomyces sp. NPDC057636 TaxID=3346189 RepID=UPI0036D09F16